MPVRIALALLGLSVRDSRALRPERSFVHDLSIRTENQNQHGLGRSGSSLEETLLKKRSARAAEQKPARAESTTPDTTMRLFLLPELNNEKKGGRCMDGTQAGYYYGGPSSGESTTWVFYMNGGGGCSDVEDCADWMNTGVGETQANKGSSGWRNNAHDPELFPKVWGDIHNGRSFLSSDQSLNPGFHDAHHVRIPYCTGDSHGGTVGKPDDAKYGGKYVHEDEGGLYLDGHLNFKRILRDLEEKVEAFSTAEHVLLFGGSAGGKGVFYNCDFLQRQITKAGGSPDAVRCAPESGMFAPAYWANNPGDLADPDEPPLDWDSWIAGVPRPESTAGMYGEPYITRECEHEDAECVQAGIMYKYIKAPMYVKQDEFDSALVGNLGLKGDNLVTPDGHKYLGLVGKSVRETLKHRKEGDGVYLTSCFAHGGHAATANGGDVTYEQSLADWFWEGRQNPDPFWDNLDVPHALMDTCTESEGLPCNPNCDLDPCTVAVTDMCVDWVPDCAGCINTNKAALIAAGCNKKGFENAINSLVGCDLS